MPGTSTVRCDNRTKLVTPLAFKVGANVFGPATTDQYIWVSRNSIKSSIGFVETGFVRSAVYLVVYTTPIIRLRTIQLNVKRYKIKRKKYGLMHYDELYLVNKAFIESCFGNFSTPCDVATFNESMTDLVHSI